MVAADLFSNAIYKIESNRGKRKKGAAQPAGVKLSMVMPNHFLHPYLTPVRREPAMERRTCSLINPNKNIDQTIFSQYSTQK